MMLIREAAWVATPLPASSMQRLSGPARHGGWSMTRVRAASEQLCLCSAPQLSVAPRSALQRSAALRSALGCQGQARVSPGPSHL